MSVPEDVGDLPCRWLTYDSRPQSVSEVALTASPIQGLTTADLTKIQARASAKRHAEASVIQVTEEMIDAGIAAHNADDGRDERGWFAAIYRAMAALAPVELVSAGELKAIKQRDEARRGLYEAPVGLVEGR